jgi:hypothetical protein
MRLTHTGETHAESSTPLSHTFTNGSDSALPEAVFAFMRETNFHLLNIYHDHRGCSSYFGPLCIW